MSVHANKALYYRFATSIRDPRGAVGETLSPQYVDHSLPAGMPAGAVGLVRYLDLMRQSCPVSRISIEDLIAEGDRVVGRVRIQYAAAAPVPEGGSGDDGAIELIEIVRVADGRIAERWCQLDPFSAGRRLSTSVVDGLSGGRGPRLPPQTRGDGR